MTKGDGMWEQLMIRRRREAGLSVVLGLQASIMFVVAPMAATGFASPAVVDAFRFGLAAAAVLMLTRSRTSALIIGATFVASLVLSITLRGGVSQTAVYILRLLVTSAFDAAVAYSVARLAFGSGKVTVHRIMGGVILYLSIGLLFANGYRAADLLLHASFGGLGGGQHAALSELLYFSLSTLTTTGFGDIRPLHPFVRSMANLEAVIGQLYPATLLARLVTLHTSAE